MKIKLILYLCLLALTTFGQEPLPPGSKQLDAKTFFSPSGDFYAYKGAAYLPNAYIKLTPGTSISSSATGLAYNSSTGVFSLTGGYVIPTTTDISNGNTAYSWGNHAGLYPGATGAGASGTWGINIAGNSASASSVAWTSVSGRPSNLSQLTNDLGNYGGWISSETQTLYDVTNKPAGAGTNTNLYIGSNYSDTWGGGALLQLNSAYGSPFYSAGMQLAGGGDLILGTYNASANFWTTGLRVQQTTGNVYATGDLTANSDEKLKTKFHSITDIANKLKQLHPVYYNLKSDGTRHVGFTAQDIQKQFPELVKDNQGTLALNYQSLTSPLVAGWQDHDQRLEKLEKQIRKLKKRQ